MTEVHDIVEAKHALRAEMMLRRGRLDADARKAGSEAVARTGIGAVEPPPGAVVSAYSAVGDELDPAALLEKLSVAGHPLALPVTTKRGKPLVFRRWAPGDPLRRAPFSLMEPDPAAPEVEPEVLLVPLLAFDARGYRLGHGAGYYDRTLHALREKGTITAIGLAFDVQEVDEVPHDGHDERLDWLLTPSGLRQAER